MKLSSKKKPTSKRRRTSTKSSTAQKSPKRATGRKKKRQKKRSIPRYVWILSILVIVGAVGVCLLRCWLPETSHHGVTPPPKKTKTDHVTLPSHKKIKPVKHEKKRDIPIKKAPLKHPNPQPIKHHTKPVVSLPSHVSIASRGERPKLAIIIDDVHTRTQLDAIEDIGFPVTPSIFPPYTLSPDTPKLAAHAVHYMIHLPMESGSVQFNHQTKTLMTNFTKAQIEARIKEIRRLFPRAHFMNNHTGSVFTADEKAMRWLYEAMRKEGFIFIDSRTSAATKVQKIAQAHGDAYVARNIFLDNNQSVPAILTQLNKAVVLAKKHGYAIAIGHPHPATMEALRRAKPILKEVEVVYIESIFRR